MDILKQVFLLRSFFQKKTSLSLASQLPSSLFLPRKREDGGRLGEVSVAILQPPVKLPTDGYGDVAAKESQI